MAQDKQEEFDPCTLLLEGMTPGNVTIIDIGENYLKIYNQISLDIPKAAMLGSVSDAFKAIFETNMQSLEKSNPERFKTIKQTIKKYISKEILQALKTNPNVLEKNRIPSSELEAFDLFGGSGNSKKSFIDDLLDEMALEKEAENKDSEQKYTKEIDLATEGNITKYWAAFDKALDSNKTMLYAHNEALSIVYYEKITGKKGWNLKEEDIKTTPAEYRNDKAAYRNKLKPILEKYLTPSKVQEAKQKVLEKKAQKIAEEKKKTEKAKREEVKEIDVETQKNIDKYWEVFQTALVNYNPVTEENIITAHNKALSTVYYEKQTGRVWNKDFIKKTLIGDLHFEKYSENNQEYKKNFNVTLKEVLSPTRIKNNLEEDFKKYDVGLKKNIETYWTEFDRVLDSDENKNILNAHNAALRKVYGGNDRTWKNSFIEENPLFNIKYEEYSKDKEFYQNRIIDSMTDSIKPEEIKRVLDKIEAEKKSEESKNINVATQENITKYWTAFEAALVVDPNKDGNKNLINAHENALRSVYDQKESDLHWPWTDALKNKYKNNEFYVANKNEYMNQFRPILEKNLAPAKIEAYKQKLLNEERKKAEQPKDEKIIDVTKLEKVGGGGYKSIYKLDDQYVIATINEGKVREANGVARMIDTEIKTSQTLRTLGLLTQDYDKVMVEIEVPISEGIHEVKEIPALKMTNYAYYAEKNKLFIRDPKKGSENQRAPNIFVEALNPAQNVEKAFSGIKADLIILFSHGINLDAGESFSFAIDQNNDNKVRLFLSDFSRETEALENRPPFEFIDNKGNLIEENIKKSVKSRVDSVYTSLFNSLNKHDQGLMPKLEEEKKLKEQFSQGIEKAVVENLQKLSPQEKQKKFSVSKKQQSLLDSDDKNKENPDEYEIVPLWQLLDPTFDFSKYTVKPTPKGKSEIENIPVAPIPPYYAKNSSVPDVTPKYKTEEPLSTEKMKTIKEKLEEVFDEDSDFEVKQFKNKDAFEIVQIKDGESVCTVSSDEVKAVKPDVDWEKCVVMIKAAVVAFPDKILEINSFSDKQKELFQAALADIKKEDSAKYGKINVEYIDPPKKSDEDKLEDLSEEIDSSPTPPKKNI